MATTCGGQLHSSLRSLPVVLVNGGIHYELMRCYNELPYLAQEPGGFSLPSTIQGSSSFQEDLELHVRVAHFYTFADPSRCFTCDVLFSGSCTLDAFSRHFVIYASLAGDIAPAVSLRASTSFRILPSGSGVSVSIAPGWWSDAASFYISGLYFAGKLLETPLLPSTVVVVNVNHTPSIMGRLLAASSANDAAGVVAAIKAGGSIEELDERVSLWLCPLRVCALHMLADCSVAMLYSCRRRKVSMISLIFSFALVHMLTLLTR